jgi:hypothetical protein
MPGPVRSRSSSHRSVAAGISGRLLVSAVLAGYAAAALPADWQEIGTDDDGNRYSLDADRMVRESGLVKAFVRTEYATPRENEDGGAAIFAAVDRLQVRCDAGTFALESRSYVTADGTEVPALASAREELTFRPAAEGSMSAAIVRRLCAKPRGR